MTGRPRGIERVAVSIPILGIAACWAAVLLRALGLSPGYVAVLLGALASVALWRLPRRLPSALDGALRRHRVGAFFFGLVLAVAWLQSARLSVFMVHSEETAFAVGTAYHSNLTGYVKGAMLARDHRSPIYDAGRSPLVEGEGDDGFADGAFHITPYQYPPPFLLLPRLFLAASNDFLVVRALWFVFMCSAVAYALLRAATWIGGRQGQLTLLQLPLLWAALPVGIDLQFGNVQIVVISVGVLAMVAFARGHAPIGGALLAFITVSKIFPAILVVYLLFQRRWRAFAWTCGFAVVYVALTLLAFGRQPFDEFIHYQLPRISDGSAFGFLRRREWFVLTDSAFLGIGLKLHALGVPGASWETARLAARLYGPLVLGIAIVAARRAATEAGAIAGDSSAARLGYVLKSSALLHLASLQSPFLAEPMASFTLLWLLVLVGAEDAAPGPWFIAVLGLAWLALSVFHPYPYTLFGRTPSLLIALALQLTTIAATCWLVLRRPVADRAAHA